MSIQRRRGGATGREKRPPYRNIRDIGTNSLNHLGKTPIFASFFDRESH